MKKVCNKYVLFFCCIFFQHAIHSQTYYEDAYLVIITTKDGNYSLKTILFAKEEGLNSFYSFKIKKDEFFNSNIALYPDMEFYIAICESNKFLNITEVSEYYDNMSSQKYDSLKAKYKPKYLLLNKIYKKIKRKTKRLKIKSDLYYYDIVKINACLCESNIKGHQYLGMLYSADRVDKVSNKELTILSGTLEKVSLID